MGKIYLNDVIKRNQWLCETFPWLVPTSRFTGKVIDNFHYEFTELDLMPRGWRENFGLTLQYELKMLLESEDCVYGFRIIDMVEKWGKLRIYYELTPYNEPLEEKIDDLFQKYADISEHICIGCGIPIEKAPDDWSRPMCKECEKKFENF